MAPLQNKIAGQVRNPEKDFCALKMKEVIQAKIYEEIKDMTFAELRDRYDIKFRK